MRHLKPQKRVAAHQQSSIHVLWFGLLMLLTILAAWLLSMNFAFAQTGGFSTVGQSVRENISGVPKLVAILAYVLGTFFAISGLLKL